MGSQLPWTGHSWSSTTSMMTVATKALSPGVHVALDPFEVARQIRRILRRLEQDEEICCAAAPEDEEETE